MTALHTPSAPPRPHRSPIARILVFAPDTEQARLLRQSLEDSGVAAAHVTTARDADAFLALWDTQAVVVPEGAFAESLDLAASASSQPALLVLPALAEAAPEWASARVLAVMDALP